MIADFSSNIIVDESKQDTQSTGVSPRTSTFRGESSMSVETDPGDST